MDQPKFCVDCLHYRYSLNGMLEICDRPTGSLSMITGLPDTIQTSAFGQRVTSCGKDAKYFEAKPQQVIRHWRIWK